MVVDDPKAAAREDRVGRDPGAAVGPGRMHVDERQPARSAGHRLHERLGLFQRHGVRGIAFIGLEIQGEESPWAGTGRVQEERCLLRAGRIALAEMIGTPQQSCRLGLRPSLGTHGVGIEVAFARLVDDGEDVARAYQPEIGDSGVRADVDYRIQSLGCATRRRRRDRIFRRRILRWRSLRILIRRHGGLTGRLRCAASRCRCSSQARENVPARNHAATVRCSARVATSTTHGLHRSGLTLLQDDEGLSRRAP